MTAPEQYIWRRSDEKVYRFSVEAEPRRLVATACYENGHTAYEPEELTYTYIRTGVMLDGVSQYEFAGVQSNEFF